MLSKLNIFHSCWDTTLEFWAHFENAQLGKILFQNTKKISKEILMKLTLQNKLKENFCVSGFVMSMNWCLNSFTLLWCQIDFFFFLRGGSGAWLETNVNYNRTSYYHDYTIQNC